MYQSQITIPCIFQTAPMTSTRYCDFTLHAYLKKCMLLLLDARPKQLVVVLHWLPIKKVTLWLGLKMQLDCNILMMWKLALKKCSTNPFIWISKIVCFILTTGKGRYWMEICKKQTLDLLLWRGRNRPTSFQHHPHPQIGVLLPQVDLPKALWPIAQDQERAFEDGKLRSKPRI